MFPEPRSLSPNFFGKVGSSDSFQGRSGLGCGAVQVLLGGLQRPVAEQFLDVHEIATRIQDAASCRVSQGVAVHSPLERQRSECGKVPQSVVDGACGHLSSSLGVDEQAGLSAPAPLGNLANESGVNRHKTLMASLAFDEQLAGLKVDVFHAEAGGLHHPEAVEAAQDHQEPILHGIGVDVEAAGETLRPCLDAAAGPFNQQISSRQECFEFVLSQEGWQSPGLSLRRLVVRLKDSKCDRHGSTLTRHGSDAFVPAWCFAQHRKAGGTSYGRAVVNSSCTDVYRTRPSARPTFREHRCAQRRAASTAAATRDTDQGSVCVRRGT